MILGGLEVNLFAQICFISEVRLGESPLPYTQCDKKKFLTCYKIWEPVKKERKEELIRYINVNQM